MEKVQKENDGGLSREKKLQELDNFCSKHAHNADCPMYVYCEEVGTPFRLLTDVAIDSLYEDYILNPRCEVHPKGTQEAKVDVAYAKDYIPTYKRLNQEAKADAGKAQISLVPMEIVWAIAWIRMYGNCKYGDPDNWKTVKPERYRDALMRHLLHYISDPESVDEESGYPHLWHAACNMAFLMHFDYGPMAYFDWNEELWEKVKKGEIG